MGKLFVINANHQPKKKKDMKDLNDIIEVGIDIGTSKICALAGSQEADGKIKIRGFVERAILPIDEVLKNGEIENANRTIEIIDEILEELALKLNLNCLEG